MSDTQARDFDLDEDLFDFGSAGQEPEPAASEEDLDEIFASFREEAMRKEPLAAPAASATDSGTKAATQPEPKPSTPRAEPQAPAPRPGKPAAHAPAESAAPLARRAPAHTDEHVLTPAPRALRFSRGLVAIALSVTVLNAALAVVMLRGNSDRHDVRATADEPAPDAREEAPARPSAHAEPLPDPESVRESYDHPTLDEARADLARGDHAAARQRVYGLLSIVDRLEEPRKSELEAECQYLIAQSLHLEALARMGGQE